MFKKIVFMGTPNFSVPVLKSLYQNGYPIITVYTQPPKKSMRGQKINKSPIQKLSENLQLNIRTPKSLYKNKEELKYFKSLNADIVVVVAYGQIIPNEYLSLSKNGFINIHASLLPKWRGAAPIQRAIMNSDKLTGISIMKIVEKLDAGPVMKTEQIHLNQDMNTEQVSNILSDLSSKTIIKCIDQIENGQKTLHVVNDKLGTPTYTHDFAKNCKILIENNHRGLFNMVCGGLTGRLEVATELVTELGLKKEIEIEEVTSEYFKEEYFAPRPPSERLVNKKLELRGLNFMRDWKVCLKEYLEEYYEGYLK